MINRTGPICSLGKLAYTLYGSEKASLIDASVFVNSFDHLSNFDAKKFDYLSPLISFLTIYGMFGCCLLCNLHINNWLLYQICSEVMYFKQLWLALVEHSQLVDEVRNLKL
jgi:hypothetical protein